MATLNGKNILNLKNPLTCSHWEEQNYRVLLKIFCFAKNPFTHLDKGCRNAHPFPGFFSKIFLRKNFTLHLFGIEKSKRNLFQRKIFEKEQKNLPAGSGEQGILAFPSLNIGEKTFNST